jgi:GMP synthase-like glutamine amidotransferase
MRVAIIENTEVTYHGQVGVALHAAGARIDLWKPWRDNVLPDLGAYDALVVFGGEQNALADATHPYLPRLARMMRDSADMGIAVLGICLGSQIFARGLGASNQVGGAGEYGWCTVNLTDEGRADPVLGTLPADFPIMQWHSDTFTAPPGSVHLATSAKAPAQCFRYGRAGYAMQFHFEANRAVVTDWANEFADAFEASRPGWIADFHAHADRDAAAADAHGLAMARAWVGLIPNPQAAQK